MNIVVLSASDAINDELEFNIYDSFYKSIEVDNEIEVETFVSFGADINHRYEMGKTPLMIAADKGSIGAVRALLKLGANVDLLSEDNLTALDYAEKNNNEYIITVLKSKKLSEPQVTSTNKSTNNINSDLDNKKLVVLDIRGTYKTQTKAIFSKCGANNQRIEYLAEEIISNQTESESFKLSYQAPLLRCEGTGKLLKGEAQLIGNYNCQYQTTTGSKGTLEMKIKGSIFKDKLIMKYKGYDTTPGILCSYDWERTLTLKKTQQAKIIDQ